MSQLVGLPSASICIPPDPLDASAESSEKRMSAEATRPSGCPWTGPKARSVSTGSGNPQTSGASSSPPAHPGQGGGSCPFAAVIPSSRQPIAVTAPDGSVVHVRRKCPAWIRVLRFTAKYIARTVLTRTAKSVLVTAFHSTRRRSSGTTTSSVSSRASSRSASVTSDSEHDPDSGSESESEL